MSGPTRSILIAATPRCGSYHFCDQLAQFTGIPQPEEHLNYDFVQVRSDLALAQDAPIELVFDRLVRHYGADGIFTLKAMWDAFADVFVCMAAQKDLPDPENIWHTLSIQVFPRPQYLFIRRRAKVRQAVSFLKALQTGVWRAEAPTDTDERSLAYSFFKIHDALQLFERCETGWLDYFHGMKIPFLEIWYEDFIADRLATLRRVSDFLGLQPRMDTLPPALYVPVGSHVNTLWAALFKEQFTEASAHDAGEPIRWLPAMDGPVVRYMDGTPDMCQAGAQIALAVRLSNTGPVAWPGPGQSNGNGWLRLRVALLRDGAVVHTGETELYQKLQPGAGCEIRLPLTLPATAGAHTLEAWVEQTGAGRLCEPVRHDLNIEETPIIRALNGLFAPWSDVEIAGWKAVPGLGRIQVDYFPWIYYPPHGWLFIKESDSKAGALMVWDAAIGWLWLTLDAYPNGIIRMTDSAVLDFEGLHDGLRVFRRVDTGERLSVPRNPGDKD